MTTFNFHPVKTVTGGEGGAVLTNNEEYYKKLLLYRAHGITRNSSLMEKESHGGWYYAMTEKDVEDVIHAVKKIVENCRK